jgi:hypothetical protein
MYLPSARRRKRVNILIFIVRTITRWPGLVISEGHLDNRHHERDSFEGVPGKGKN